MTGYPYYLAVGINVMGSGQDFIQGERKVSIIGHICEDQWKTKVKLHFDPML